MILELRVMINFNAKQGSLFNKRSYIVIYFEYLFIIQDISAYHICLNFVWMSVNRKQCVIYFLKFYNTLSSVVICKVIQLGVFDKQKYIVNLSCSANQWTGFYMISASVMKSLMEILKNSRIEYGYGSIRTTCRKIWKKLLTLI